MLRKLHAYFLVYYDLSVAYRAEIMLWAVATALPLIMMGVWTQAAASGSFVMSSAQVARYFIAVYLIRQLTIVWVIYDFEWHVVEGRLSPRLLHPIDPGWSFFIAHFSEQACRLPIVVALVGLCFLIFPEAFLGSDEAGGAGPWTPGWGRGLLALLAVYLAFCCRYALQYSLSMLAFWLERVVRVDELFMIPFMFFSGILFPLEELRAWSPLLYEIAMATPFPYMLWFPATLLTGGEVPIVRGFAVLTAWLIVFFIVNRILWRRGLKHYSAMGA